MALNFPASPSLNDIHTEAGRSWRFNGTAWDGVNSGGAFEDPAHLTTGDSTVAYTLQYEFDSAADLTAATIITPSGTSDESIINGVLSTISDDQSAYHVCGAVWPHVLAVGDCVETAFSMWMLNAGNYPMAGVVVSSGAVAGSDIQAAGMYIQGVAEDNHHNALNYIFGGTFNATSEYGTAVSSSYASTGAMKRPYRVRITRVDADTWKAEYSDGGAWTQFGLDMEWDDTMTPSHVGVYWSTWTGVSNPADDPVQFSFDYIRVYTP